MSPRAEEIQNARVFSSSQVLLPEISYESFTYPGDEEALAALKKVPGAPALLTYLQENFTEQLIYVENNEQMIRAGTGSFGRSTNCWCAARKSSRVRSPTCTSPTAQS